MFSPVDIFQKSLFRPISFFGFIFSICFFFKYYCFHSSGMLGGFIILDTGRSSVVWDNVFLLSIMTIYFRTRRSPPKLGNFPLFFNFFFQFRFTFCFSKTEAVLFWCFIQSIVSNSLTFLEIISTRRL